ncbi:MAG: exonuclease domain-containing protein [Rhodospirillaceae bacterium]
MLNQILGQDLARLWFGFRAHDGALKNYYSQDYPTLNTGYDEVEFVAIDIECTGLDSTKDEIISVGLVPIIDGAIRLSEAEYHLVKPTFPVPPETAVIHGILDGHLETAPPLEDVLPLVLDSIAGRVPVAHHCRIEEQFLSQACRKLYGLPLAVPYVDTMSLEIKRFRRRHSEKEAKGSFRLGAIRDRYKLPRYRAHNALIDAIACAEVFLAQASGLSGKKQARLGDLLEA